MMDIKYLSEEEYHELLRLLKLNHIECPKNSPYAFSVITGEAKMIIYNNDCGLDQDYKRIVIQHERAHLAGVELEEMADRWALKRLNRKQKKILESEWEHRHGHKFEEMDA